MKPLDLLIDKIKTLKIKVTGYCTRNAEFRRVNIEDLVNRLKTKENIYWRLSKFKGEKGQRIEAYCSLSKRRAVKAIIEVNKKQVHLVNVININPRKQRRLRHG